jgi:hypothetical protein
MKTNPDYILRKIAGETVLVPTGDAAFKLNGMIHLTDTALFIWEHIDSASGPEDIVRGILREYDTDEETARSDVYGFLEILEQRGMLEK